MVERDNVQFVVGPIFSNVLAAIYRPVTESKTFLISPNAGPSSFAGKACSPYFTVTSYQNDQNHEVLGKVAQDRNLKRVVLLVPNYQAGKDSVAGFKRHFKGEIVDEVYVPLGQLDFAAELAKLASQKPDAVFTFMPGGMGVNLVKQFRQAGLADQMVVPLRLHRGRGHPPRPAGRRHRPLRRQQLGAGPRHAAEQGLRRRLREGIRLRAGELRHARLRRRMMIDAAVKRRAASLPTRTLCRPR